MDIHLEFTKQDENVPTDGPDRCPKCDVEAESAFGMAGGGYGIYTYCPTCGQMLSKTQIEE